MKNRITAAIAAALLLGTTGMTASAAEPYETYTYDSFGDAIPSQAGYVPERAVSGYDLGVGALNAPTDIFCAADGMFYIADSENNRLIAADGDLTSAVRVYDSFTLSDGTSTSLKTPKGVYVSPVSGYIYIADSGNDRILIADTEGNVVRQITRPDSVLFTAPTFKPQKVAADKAGNVYTVLGNITTGAAMFTAEGEFSGFYGANRVQPTAEIIRDRLFGLFMSDEKRLRRKRNVPSGITGFDIDGDFIYTCTASSTQKTDTVKKLNAAGNNIFADRELVFGDIKPMYDTTKNKVYEPAMTDIDIGEDGCINCLDLTTGRIFRYDEDCQLMFIVGTKAEQLGGFKTPSALESKGECLYVADSEKNTITVFRETSFGRTVNRAVTLYNDGYYEEALEPWYEVLSRDGNYRRANIGVASALLRKGDFRGAMKYAKLADSPEIYNKAFEGYRREFLKAHFGVIFFGTAAAVTGVVILHKRRRRKHGGGEPQ